MNRPKHLAVIAALFALGACSKPGIDAPPPATPGDAPAAPSAERGSAAVAAPSGTPGDATPDADRYDPVVSATPAGWLVGWTSDGERGTRVALAFVAKDAAIPERLAATQALGEVGAAGLRLAGSQAVWVEGSGDARRIVAQRLDAKGAAGPAPVVLATGPKLGNPEATLTHEGVVVAWTDGLHARAVKLDDDGGIGAKAAWWGGNARPESHFRPDDAPPDPNPERSEATGARPWILQPGADAPVEVRWEAEWWLSDDQGGQITARHAIAWGEATGDAEETERPGGVWTWLADVDPGSARTVVQEHDPNGGPWILWLAGQGDEPVEIARGPAGPYAVDLTSAPAPVVAFHDPATSRYRVVRLDGDGARREVGLPTTAPFGEASVALTASGGEVGVAYATVAEGRLAVRLAVLGADASGDRDGPRLVRPDAQRIEVGTRFSMSRMDALHVGGQTLVTWQDHWDWRIRAVWLKDGVPGDPLIELTPRSPRSEGGALAALPDGAGALTAFQSCSGSSICGDTTLHVLKLAPGGTKPTPVDLGQRKNDRHPRLCVGPMGPVLAVQRGDYGSVSVMWGPTGERHTVDIPTPNRNNGGFPQGLTCGEGGIFVVMTSFGREHGATRVDLVKVDEGGAATRETLEVPGSLWSYHGLVDDGGRVGLLTNLDTPTGAQVALRWYPTGGGEPTVDVLQRNLTMFNPHVTRFGTGAERRFAGTWYDRGSDAVYAALVAPDGRRVGGPVRLDDPAARESQNAPVILREGDRWTVYWEERDALYRARPF